MVVMGPSKVIFLPGSQSERVECNPGALGAVMLPVHSPSSPESASGDHPPRKRQRLTHLSPEEKALRRKLKNRVAAQTARDRKKARMGELEQQVLDLELENDKLIIENKLLREKSHGLVAENQELRQRLGLGALEVKEEKEEFEVLIQSTEDEVSSEDGSAESAAGAGPDSPEPDQVFMDPDSPNSSESESDILLGILESLNSDLLLTCEAAVSWNPQENVKGADSDSLSIPPSSDMGSPSAKLEAINELIRFDHVYTKPLSSEQDSELVYETCVIKMEEASFSPSHDNPASVKQEPQDDDPTPVLGMQSFLSSPQENVEHPVKVMDSGSDSGYEGCSSPFSEISSSPLNSDQVWEDSFTTELFPQLLSVHMNASCSPSSPDTALFWNQSTEFEDGLFSNPILGL